MACLRRSHNRFYGVDNADGHIGPYVQDSTIALIDVACCNAYMISLDIPPIFLRSGVFLDTSHGHNLLYMAHSMTAVCS